MSVQLNIWEYLLNNSQVPTAKLVVIFTKEDRLTPEHLTQFPFAKAFPDFQGNGQDVEHIIQYFASRLLLSVH
ncbi:Uu.00g130790.m01.CDS01, partial [Anthostomella pinea]